MTEKLDPNPNAADFAGKDLAPGYEAKLEWDDVKRRMKASRLETKKGKHPTEYKDGVRGKK